MKKTVPACLSRVCALGLVAATVVTGLTLSPVGSASAQPASSASPAPGQEASAPPAASTGTPVDVSGSTPVDIADEIPAPTVTKARRYVDAVGATKWHIEGTGPAGAQVDHRSADDDWSGGAATVDADGRFRVTTDVAPSATAPLELRFTVGEGASPVTEVPLTSFVAKMLDPVITSQTATRADDGVTTYHFEGRGVPGASIFHRVNASSWGTQVQVDDDGAWSIEHTATPRGNGAFHFVQQIVGQPNSDIVVIAGPPVVTSSSTRLGDGGEVIHRFEGTGRAGATVVHRTSPRSDWDEGASVAGDQTWSLETTSAPAEGGTFQFAQQIAGQPASIVTDVPSAPIVTKSTSYVDVEGRTVHRHEGRGIVGAVLQHAASDAAWTTVTPVRDDGSFSFETTSVPSDDEATMIRQKLGAQASPTTAVAASDITVEFPVVTDIIGSTEFDASGNTIHRYEGKGVVGATIQFKRPTGGWGDGGTVAADGTFSFVTGWLATEDGYITIRQTLGDQTSTGVGAPKPAENVSVPFAMTSPSTGDTFTPGTTAVFEGTGTAGSTITVAPQRGLTPVQATVDKTGHWTARKPLGNGTYVFDITQTSPTGQAQGVINAFIYAPTGSSVERNFEMITPRVGDSFTPDSFVYFVGQGTPGATITLKPQAGLSEATETVGADGFWKIRRGMGNGTYIFSVTQTIGGVVTGKPIVGFVYGPTVDGDPITRPFAVTSHASGDTFPANTTVAITGTGTPNATVTLRPQGNLREQTVPVSRDGYWVANRAMGGGAYTFTITQTLEGEVVGTPLTDFVLTPAP